MLHQYLKSIRKKRGSATTEAAIILPILCLLTFGAMEYGWMFYRMHQITNVARSAVRQAALPQATNETVSNTITGALDNWGMGSSAYTVTCNPNDVTILETGEPITITISVPYTNVDLLSLAFLPTPTNITARASMAKEGP